MGNMDSKRSLNLFNRIGKILNAEPLSSNRDLEKYHVLDLRNKSYVYRSFTKNEDNDKTDSILNYYQIGKRNIISFSYLKLIEEVVNQQIFEFLENSEESGQY